jgi:hypothetical protein
VTGKNSKETAVSGDDIAEMAKILQKKYGEKAVEVADVLMRDHVSAADRKRASAWAAVSRYLCQAQGFSVSLQ